MKLSIKLANEKQLAKFANKLAQYCPDQFVIWLQGPLGAGKTTFVRYFFRGLGHTGTVKSPTYALIESYKLSRNLLLHCDFYRMTSPEEYDYLGLDVYQNQPCIMCFEWPENVGDQLPKPDIIVNLSYADEGRALVCQTETEQGKSLLQRLQESG